MHITHAQVFYESAPSDASFSNSTLRSATDVSNIINTDVNAQAVVTYGAGFEGVQKNAFEHAVREFLNLLNSLPRYKTWDGIEPLKISVSFGNTGSSIATSTFYSLSDYDNFQPDFGNGMSYSSLFGKKYKLPTVILKSVAKPSPQLKAIFPNNIYDITIKFSNQDIFFYGEKSDIGGSDKYDFITIALREMVRSVVTSSIQYRSGEYKLNPTIEEGQYELGYRFVYDEIIGLINAAYGGQSRIQNYLNTNISINNQGNSFAGGLGLPTSYKIYSPNPFINNISLNYLDVLPTDSQLGLLTPFIPKETVFRNVTEAIKWLIFSIYPQIYYTGGGGSKDLSVFIDSNPSMQNNILNHNNSYNFAYHDGGRNIYSQRNGNWKFELKKKDGTYETKITSNGNLIISAGTLLNSISSTGNYLYHETGVTARVTYDDPQNPDIHCEYHFDIPTKPAKPYFKIKEAVDNGYPDEKDVTFEFVCDGASKVELAYQEQPYGYVDFFDLGKGNYFTTYNYVNMTITNKFVIYATNSMGTTLSDPIYIGGSYLLNNKINMTVSVENRSQLDLLFKDDRNIVVDNININEIYIQSASIPYLNIREIGNNLNRESINISELPSGIYGVKAIDSNGIVYDSKIVK